MKGQVIKLKAKLKADSPGFTLAEVMVTVGIFTATSGLIAGSLFQILSLERGWRDDVVATRELRHANFIFASNALNATSTSLVSGATPVSTVTLTWTDNLGGQHTAVYGVSGNSLSRTLDGVSTTLSARVFSGAFLSRANS